MAAGGFDEFDSGGCEIASGAALGCEFCAENVHAQFQTTRAADFERGRFSPGVRADETVNAAPTPFSLRGGKCA